MKAREVREKYPGFYFFFVWASELFFIIGAIMLGVVLYEWYGRANTGYLLWAGIFLVMIGLGIKEMFRIDL